MFGKFRKRKGLEGPIDFPNNRVLYFDPSCKQYWDPLTDFYLSDDDVEYLRSILFNALKKDFDHA